MGTPYNFTVIPLPNGPSKKLVFKSPSKCTTFSKILINILLIFVTYMYRVCYCLLSFFKCYICVSGTCVSEVLQGITLGKYTFTWHLFIFCNSRQRKKKNPPHISPVFRSNRLIRLFGNYILFRKLLTAKVILSALNTIDYDLTSYCKAYVTFIFQKSNSLTYLTVVNCQVVYIMLLLLL